MTRNRSIAVAFGLVAVLASGGVVASALSDLPQDAVPVQDTTADLNRQSAAQAAAANQPAQPESPATPAPAATPVAKASAPEPDEEDEKDEAKKVEPAKPAPSTTPGKRQKRRIAIVEAVDKITAQSMRFEVEVGGRPVSFNKSLIFTARACEVSASDELVEDSIAYLEVSLQPRGILNVSEPRQIFRGWMFASSPAVSGLQHPIYDAWIVGCKT